jgi:hypothetical protein
MIMAEDLARHTAQTIGVRHFLESWNDGTGSLISDLGDLATAFSFYEDTKMTWTAALIEAQALGIEEEFHAAFGALAQPTIQETFEAGLKNLCTFWARKAATKSPSQHGLATPFDDVSEWVSWCLAHLEWPPFARPWGQELIPDEQEEWLIRHALAEQHELAAEHGWISSDPRATPHATRH